MTLLKDLIEIPEHSSADDFVVKLTDARTRVASTLKEYVPTRAVVERMNTALGLVDAAVVGKKSIAAYIHGSFGSGKSHFMAVMSHLLAGEPLAFAKPEFAPVIAKNPWLGSRKVLVLCFHMLGAKSMEERILGGYLSQVRALPQHSDEKNIAVYRAEKVFDMARDERAEKGDEAFFRKLGGGNNDGWGDLGGPWSAERFDRAIDADEQDDERQALVAALLSQVFPHLSEFFEDTRSEFVAFDIGLNRIAKHAQGLGFESIVLCLDELILWFAQHASEQSFLNTEVEKLVQLVESNAGSRAIPIISFVARQRDLSELISTTLPNFAGSQIFEKLKHHEARFAATIELPDSDLPTIASVRLLSPKTQADKKTIDAAFERASTMRSEAMQVLEAGASIDDFRKVYPFSPAVVDVLIAASGLLQRDRTALKVMRELLVTHRDTLELESVIPMGDLFDQLSVGSMAIDEVFKIRFNRARTLWNERVEPAIGRKYGVVMADVRQLAAAGDVAARTALGMSRIVKTLLLANVVESKKVLANLDIKRAVHLNHGSIRAPIAGGEATQAIAFLKELATEIPEFKIADSSAPGNPFISIIPTEYDITGIVSSASEFETNTTKVQALRRMTFNALGIIESSADGFFQQMEECKLSWRRTSRKYNVIFTDVSGLSDSELSNPSSDWKVVIDYPLPGATQQGASGDRERLRKFKDSVKSARTLVWSPRTFGDSLQRDLGKLVRIQGLLKSDENLIRHTSNVAASDREAVRGLLRQQESALSSRINDALKSAYGITAVMPGVTDDVAPDQVFHSLDPSYTTVTPSAATLQEALEALVSRALNAQYPAHPDFGTGIVFPRSAFSKVLECCRRGVGEITMRTEPSLEERKPMYEIARPLGLVNMPGLDSAAALRSDVFDQLDAIRMQRPQQEISVSELRVSLDNPQARGLPLDMQDLVILLYADVRKLRFMRYGTAVNDSVVGKLHDDLVLRTQPLPELDVWTSAVRVMNAAFGSGLSSHLTVHGFGQFNNTAEKVIAVFKEGVDDLLRQLVHDRSKQYLRDECDRLKIALEAKQLFDAMCAASSEVDRVARVAKFDSDRLKAIGKSIASASNVASNLRTTTWDNFRMIQSRADNGNAAAQIILNKLCAQMSVNELDAPIGPELDQLLKESLALLVAEKQPNVSVQPPNPTVGALPATGVRVLGQEGLHRGSATEAEQSAKALLQILEENSNVKVDLNWKIVEE